MAQSNSIHVVLDREAFRVDLEALKVLQSLERELALVYDDLAARFPGAGSRK